MVKILTFLTMICMLGACAGSGRATANADASDSSAVEETVHAARPAFSADSAYAYVARQVRFGPRVPNSAAHDLTADWLAAELKRHGAGVTLQKGDLTAFDGTILHATNIMGSYNPDSQNRLLLLAHYDTRPWADEDPDPANRNKPVPGANDGASGVGVLLELARIFGENNPGMGVDILLVDCEDYGQTQDEDSWALGTRYFVEKTVNAGYRPQAAVLLDMVGARGAVFPAEYYSREAAPALDDAMRNAAERAGHGSRFPRVYGSAVTDDHLELLKAGIPAIDIIDYREGKGFSPTWHTLADDLPDIDRESLRAVGETLLEYIYGK